MQGKTVEPSLFSRKRSLFIRFPLMYCGWSTWLVGSIAGLPTAIRLRAESHQFLKATNSMPFFNAHDADEDEYGADMTCNTCTVTANSMRFKANTGAWFQNDWVEISLQHCRYCKHRTKTTNYKLYNTNKTEGMQSSDYRFQSNSDDRYFTNFTVVDTLSGLGAWTRWSPFPTLKSSIHTTRSFKLHAKDHQWRASSKSSTPHRHWKTLVAWQGTNPKNQEAMRMAPRFPREVACSKCHLDQKTYCKAQRQPQVPWMNPIKAQ